jgi:hypothetical protein
VHYGAAAADERLDEDFVGQHIQLLLLLPLLSLASQVNLSTRARRLKKARKGLDFLRCDAGEGDKQGL